MARYNNWEKRKKAFGRAKSKIHLVHFKEGQNPWATYFNQTVKVKKGCVYGIFHGKVGSGKSWSMLSLLEQSNPDIDLNECFYFSAGKMISDIDKFYNRGSAKLGKEWALDEAGISVASHKHFDAVNKGLNAFMQVARHRSPILLCTVPNFNFVSKGVRTMMNVVGETVGWNAREQTSSIALRILDYNADYDKYYKKRLYVYQKDKGIIPCNQTTLPKPSKRILTEYEKLKKEFTSDLFGSISKEIKNYEEKQEEKAYGSEPTPKQQSILELLKRGRVASEIATLQGLSEGMIGTQMRFLKKKGYKFEAVKIDGTNKNSHYIVTEPEV